MSGNQGWDDPKARETVADARRHPRFTVDVAANVSTRGNKLPARTRDVSRAGICLITEQTVAAGEPLSVSLVLAFGEESFSEPLRLTARVVWCTPIGKSFQVGAMFDDLSDEQDSFLDMFLQFLDGTLAPRGGGSGDDDDDQDDDAAAADADKDDPFHK